MICPTGIVKVPISYPEKPLKTLSKTRHAIDGAYRSSQGIGTLKLMTELIVGSDPEGPD